MSKVTRYSVRVFVGTMNGVNNKVIMNEKDDECLELDENMLPRIGEHFIINYKKIGIITNISHHYDSTILNNNEFAHRVNIYVEKEKK